MRYSSRNKRKYIIIGLCFVLLLMIVGYASFSTVLTINSSSEITSSWDVEITNVRGVNDGSLTYNDAYDKLPPSISESKLSVTIQTGLLSPGDTRIYEIEVSNLGNLDSEITTSFQNKINDSTLFTYDGVSPVGSVGTDILTSSGSYDSSLLETEEPFFIPAFTNNKRYIYLTIKYKDSVTSQPKDLNPSVTLTLDVKQKSHDSSTSSFGVETVTVGGVEIPVVNSGDGLYYEDYTDSYVFKGGNPDNYISFNNEVWRIMNINSKGEIQIIRNNKLSEIPFDPGYQTTISGITNANENSGTRYSSSSNDYCYKPAARYYGCKVWGSRTSMRNASGENITSMPLVINGGVKELPIYDSYVNVYLNGGIYPTASGTTELTGWYSTLTNLEEKSFVITSAKWNVGLVSDVSTQTLLDDITQEKNYIWMGTVGLMTASDYVKGSNNTYCNSVYSYFNDSNCYNNTKMHNYLDIDANQWTVSPYSRSNTDNPWSINNRNYNKLWLNWYSCAHEVYAIKPSLWLKSNTVLTGSGTNDENIFRITT